MMHSYTARQGASFKFSADLSGMVSIVSMDRVVEVDFSDLREFVKAHKMKGPATSPKDPERAEKRAKELTAAKEIVIRSLELAAGDVSLTALEGELFNMAINSVKGAR